METVVERPDVLEETPVLRALRNLRGRATVGDVVAETGLPREQTEQTLRELLGTYRGHLAVSDKGDLVYEFEPKLMRRDRESWWSRFKRGAKRFLTGAFKAWIVVMLVVYFVVFVALLVAAMMAVLSGNGNRQGGGNRRSSRGMRIPTFWIWYLFWTRDWRYGRPYYGYRHEQRRGTKVPFYKKVFAFVFGPDEPHVTPAARDRALVEMIRSRRGVITTTELVQHTGMTSAQAAEEMARLVSAFNGDVRVSEKGELAYVFPELLLSAHGRVHARPAEPAWRRLERARAATGNKAATDALIAGLNGFNLVAAATSPLFIFPRLGLEGPLAWGFLVWVPLTFSAIFFAVPLFRRAALRRANAARSRENLRKVLLGVISEAGIEGHATSVAGATAWARKALEDPNLTEQTVNEELQRLAVEFDAGVEAEDDGTLRYRFPQLRAALAAADEMRARLRLEQQQVGAIVYDTGDTAAEDSRRALASFDSELKGKPRLPGGTATAWVDEFDAAFDEEPAGR